MVTIPNKTLPEYERPLVTSDERNSAPSLKTTFAGWGPRL
jgi:hypothetical protein